MKGVGKRFKELRKDESGAVTATMAQLIGVAIVLLIIAIVFTIAPLLGYKIESVVTLPNTTQWNPSVNTDIPTGYGFWGSYAPMIGIVALVLLISLIFGVLMGLIKVER